MVAQVPPDAVQFMQDFDPVPAQIVRAADARQLQKLGRVERAAAKDDLAVRPDALLVPADQVPDAFCPVAVEFDLRHVRLGHDG